ncbi:MAG TPA: ferrochelatase [Chitinophagaceae bacterium]|nr:ferrochelatase [Chitinophagaceae bacterium]HEX5653927.1 ferrochelatase [Chitinophagaceae bacterium]
MQKTITRGTVLMNLGSPDSTRVSDVRRYLNEFLMDGRVIDMPYLLRLLLVKGIIVPFRAPKSAKAYQSIWTKEGSPLIVISRQLQEALQQKTEDPVAIAMRYGSPSPAEAFDELMEKVPGLEEVLAIPLYPHYAMSSYETAVEYAKEVHRKKKYPFRLNFIKPYYNEENYLDALAESIRPFLQHEYDHILFSYHGVPERHILKGDITGSHCLKVENCCEVDSPAHQQCYRHQCLETTRLVAEKLQLTPGRFSFSFQSRLGRDEWLKPYTAMRLEQLPGEGIKKLLVVCPAFVSDCLETLEEIAEEGKETFLHAGGESFIMIPCLNIHPAWVQAVAGYVKNVMAGDKEMLLK